MAGKAEPTDAEVEAGQKADSDDEDDEDEEEEGAKITEVTEVKDESKEKVTGIPEFWLTALRNHVPISETITDRDEEVSCRCTFPHLSFTCFGCALLTVSRL